MNEEIIALDQAGMRMTQRYQKLSLDVQELEEEEESRNYSIFCKITEPNLPHYKFSCIGSQTCLKQKNIKRAFPSVLQQCKRNAEENDKMELENRKRLGKQKTGKDTGHETMNSNSSKKFD